MKIKSNVNFICVLLLIILVVLLNIFTLIISPTNDTIIAIISLCVTVIIGAGTIYLAFETSKASEQELIIFRKGVTPLLLIDTIDEDKFTTRSEQEVQSGDLIINKE